MTRLGSLMLVLFGPLVLTTSSWAQPEFVDSKAAPGAFDPIVVPTPDSIGGDPIRLSYWRRLHHMLASTDNWKLPSKATGEPRVIDSAEGVGGLRFGMTTDGVVALWGLPTGIHLRTMYGTPDLELNYGSNRLGFDDDALCSIALFEGAVPDASFSNGISFESSSEDVLAAFGPPFEEDHSVVGSHVLWFHDGEMRLRFHFTEGYETPKPERLIVIELTKCGER